VTVEVQAALYKSNLIGLHGVLMPPLCIGPGRKQEDGLNGLRGLSEANQQPHARKGDCSIRAAPPNFSSIHPSLRADGMGQA
jgi:hypothetical protein